MSIRPWMIKWTSRSSFFLAWLSRVKPPCSFLPGIPLTVLHLQGTILKGSCTVGIFLGTMLKILHSYFIFIFFRCGHFPTYLSLSERTVLKQLMWTYGSTKTWGKTNRVKNIAVITRKEKYSCSHLERISIYIKNNSHKI